MTIRVKMSQGDTFWPSYSDKWARRLDKKVTALVDQSWFCMDSVLPMVVALTAWRMLRDHAGVPMQMGDDCPLGPECYDAALSGLYDLAIAAWFEIEEPWSAQFEATKDFYEAVGEAVEWGLLWD